MILRIEKKESGKPLQEHEKPKGPIIKGIKVLQKSQSGQPKPNSDINLFAIKS